MLRPSRHTRATTQRSARAIIEFLEGRTLLTGDFDFAATLGDAGADAANSAFTDRNGNIYVTGTFSGLVDFDPDAGVSTMNSVGGKDFFVAKFAADHSFVWARQIGGSGDEIAGGVIVDKPGNVYVTGGFTGTADFRPGKPALNLTSAGLVDLFVWKLDANGALVWARQGGGTNSDWGTAITLDATGNVYTTGGFRGTIDMDPSASSYLIRGAGLRDAFMWKLNPSGSLVAARSVGGVGADLGTGIAIDRYGNIWTTGAFSGTADMDPGKGVLNKVSSGGQDIFITELSSNAKIVQSFTMGGTGNDVPTGLTLDRSLNVYTVGTFEGTADFDPSFRTRTRTSAGGTDGFLSILTSTFGFITARSVGGTGQDAINALTIDANNNAYVAGSFEDTADLDPGTGVADFSAEGGIDSFVAKYTSIGQYVYARATGGSEDDSASGIALAGGSEVISVGSFGDTANLDPRDDNEFSSEGDTDVYLTGLTQATPDLGAAASVGADGTTDARAIVAGPAGTTYIVGSFSGPVDFDPSHVDVAMRLASNGDSDVFVEKLDADGQVLWVRSVGGADIDTATSAAVTPDGQVYITGRFQDTVDFDPGAATHNVAAAGTYDGYVLKLDASGNFVWADTYGGAAASVLSNSIALDSEGFVYVAGGFTDTVDFETGTGVTNLTSAGSADIFALNLFADGTFLWARQMGGTNLDLAEGIAVDYNGDVYTTGQFAGTADFNPGTGTFNLTATGTGAAFVSKLSTDGNFDYAVALTGDQSVFGAAIAVDSSLNAFVTGSFSGTTDFDPSGATLNRTSAGNEDVFAVKLDVDAATVWAYTAGGAGHDSGRAIDLDPSGNVLLAGSFTDTAAFSSTSLTSEGVEDIFVAKLTANGTLSWARGQGGSGSDLAFGVRSGGSGSFIFVTGQFEDAVNFDLSGDTATVSTGETTSFVERIVQ